MAMTQDFQEGTRVRMWPLARPSGYPNLAGKIGTVRMDMGPGIVLVSLDEPCVLADGSVLLGTQCFTDNLERIHDR